MGTKKNFFACNNFYGYRVPEPFFCAGEPYKGKAIQIITGGSPGGGYDTYARTIARHITAEKIQAYTKELLSLTPETQKRLEFLVRK